MGTDYDFQYSFELEDGRTLSFGVHVDAPATEHGDSPAWTELGVQQCPNCPLDPKLVRHCPTAVAVADVVGAFARTASTERVVARVATQNRTTELETDVQTGLRSLIGLIMPTSGCPILGRLMPLARHHLPFSDYEETVFRVVGAYLVEQYVASRTGGDPDWELEGIRELYRELAKVDTAFVNRLREASVADASLNAVVALFSLATLVTISLDEDLERVRDRMKIGPPVR